MSRSHHRTSKYPEGILEGKKWTHTLKLPRHVERLLTRVCNVDLSISNTTLDASFI